MSAPSPAKDDADRVASVERIVVGIDGSEGSRRALAWALEEALCRRAALRVVYVWSAQNPTRTPGMRTPYEDSINGVERERHDAESLLDRELAVVGAASTGLDVERVAVCGAAVPTLVEAAEGSRLLVVGSRGLGGFSSLTLGSVSQQCAHHARCPVVIVPTARPRSPRRTRATRH